MKVHLVSPGIASVQLSGGGTSLFRGLASVASGVADVLSYEPLADCVAWQHPRVESMMHKTPREAIDQVLEASRKGDIVLKFAGALPGRWDMVCDIELARTAKAKGFRLVYGDADGPSRLPILQYAGSYLDVVLPHSDAVLLCGGGSRAAHAYRWLTSAPIWSFSLALTWFGVSVLNDANEVNSTCWDVAAVFGGDASRHVRVVSLLSAFADAGLTIAFAGPEPPGLPAGVSCLGFLDGSELARLVRGSRFTPSLLRDDVKGYAEVHACRMIEAARLRSLLVCDPFPGIARLFIPHRDVIMLDHDPAVTVRRLVSMPETQRREMTSRAHNRVAAAAIREAKVLTNRLGQLSARAGSF